MDGGNYEDSLCSFLGFFTFLERIKTVGCWKRRTNTNTRGGFKSNKQINKKAKVIIELKGKNTAKPVAILFERYLQKGFVVDSFLVILFNSNELFEFKKHMPQVKTGLIFNKISKAKLVCDKSLQKLDYIVLNFEYTTQKVVDLIHKINIKIYVYTPNQEHEIESMHSLGVDAVTSDYPDKI